MSLQDLLARLRADLAVAKDRAHGERTQAIVDAAPTLLDVVEAAAKYREAHETATKCAHLGRDTERAWELRLEAEAALFAALDRAEAEAAR